MEAQENSQTEQNVQTPKKRELALVSRSTYIKEKALQWIFFACAFLAVVTVILIFVFTTYSALPVFTDIGLADFFSFTWAPSEGHYGILSLLAGSGLVTVGALAMGVPLGVGTAVYLVEIASKRVRKLISPAVDLLAGIPSIIYGFFGMIIIRPFIAQLTGGLGFGALTAWFVLAIMIVLPSPRSPSMLSIPFPWAFARHRMPWAPPSGRPSIRSCYLPRSWVSLMPSCWVWAVPSARPWPCSWS